VGRSRAEPLLHGRSLIPSGEAPSERAARERWREVSSKGNVRPDVGAALLDLYDEARPEVYGYLLARCGSRALAEDLTAETFLAAAGAPGPRARHGHGWAEHLHGARGCRPAR
jgi:hypothetical protein